MFFYYERFELNYVFFDMARSGIFPGPMDLFSIATAVPITFAVAAASTPLASPFRAATAAAGVAGLLTVAICAGAFVFPGLPWGLAGVGQPMLLLVTAIAAVIIRYSSLYLQQDPGQRRFVRWLLATLSAVTLLITSNHLLIIGLAWGAVSLSVHRLLLYFPNRPQAQIAAHKKFLVSRLADVSLTGALVLIWLEIGSLDIEAVNGWRGPEGMAPASLQLAAVLLVLAVALKSAQLPFHGWLTQVMEAPTPVSALLHAGVVNIGGFLMVRLAPFMSQAPVAQLLLVIIGTTTAVVAALVMTTRVSVKVALAWSTCAQLGFMLVECGLGAWDLAMLHLVAHSLYKAHAFLGSGSAVDAWRVRSISPASALIPLGLVALGSGIVAGGFAVAIAMGVRLEPRTLPLMLLLGFSVATLLARSLGQGPAGLKAFALRGLGLTVIFLGWHALAGQLFAMPAGQPMLTATWLVASGGFALLFVVERVLHARPHGSLARALQPRLFAGLYLDELFTRMTFWLWPPKRRAAGFVSNAFGR